MARGAAVLLGLSRLLVLLLLKLHWVELRLLRLLLLLDLRQHLLVHHVFLLVLLHLATDGLLLTVVVLLGLGLPLPVVADVR